MEATVTKVAKGFSKVLEILGELPVAPEPGKVRSTTQRRGTTTKPVISLGLPIAMRNRGTFATLALRRSAALLPGRGRMSSAINRQYMKIGGILDQVVAGDGNPHRSSSAAATASG